MNSKQRRGLICRLIATMRDRNSWAGETQIQKTVLFLQELMEVPLGYKFVIYKHGPYSFDLHRELGFMRSRLYIDIELRHPYGPSFCMGRWGEEYAVASSEYDDAINFVSEKISIKTVRELESISTAFFMKQEDPGVEDQKIINRICQIKPHIKSDEARKAVDGAERIREMAPKTLLTASEGDL